MSREFSTSSTADLLFQQGVRKLRGVIARVDDHMRELIVRRVKFVHIAPLNHGVCGVVEHGSVDAVEIPFKRGAGLQPEFVDAFGIHNAAGDNQDIVAETSRQRRGPVQDCRIPRCTAAIDVIEKSRVELEVFLQVLGPGGFLVERID